MKANLKEGWVPRWKTRMPVKVNPHSTEPDPWRRPAPTHDPKWSNRQRMLQRAEIRKKLGLS